MKKSIFVVCVQAGKGMSTGKLFLIGITGESIKVSADFAASNGIDEDFTGLCMYSTEFHKAGSEYIDKAGAKQKYASDYTKITSLIPVKSALVNAECAKAVAKKAMFATAESLD